jgi:hypothetical protein
MTPVSRTRARHISASRLLLVAAMIAALALALAAGLSRANDPVAAQAATTPAAGTQLPGAVATGAAPVNTAGALPVPSGVPAGRPANSSDAPGATNANNAGALIPWLVGAVVLLGLIGVAVFALRRGATTPAAPVLAADGEAGTTGDTTRPTAVASAGTAARGATTPLTQVRCPNCDALNPADRRFCDECGQDLRPAAMAAATGALPAVDEATTPYLETLSRADEQLEFVLARKVVTLGRAPDNDIVIDNQFIGWQTVSPHHARLTEQAEGGFLLEDLQSENGTFVNSARTGQNLLEDGMTIALGKVEFIYRVPAA